jgi:hypothetical protein
MSAAKGVRMVIALPPRILRRLAHPLHLPILSAASHVCGNHLAAVGRLEKTQIIRDEQNENDDYFGPAGFKGRGKDGIETRDFTFGSFNGHIAVIKDYNPIKELETMNRKLLAIAAHGSEGEALNFIVKMTERERTRNRRTYVAIISRLG